MDTQARYSLESAIEQDRQTSSVDETTETKPEQNGFWLDAYRIQVIIAIALALSVFIGVVTA